MTLQYLIRSKINQFVSNIVVFVLFIVMFHTGYNYVNNWYHSVENRLAGITNYLNDETDSVSSSSTCSKHTPKYTSDIEMESRSE